MAIDRKKGKPLSDEDIENLVGKMVDEAADYSQEELSDLRETALDYYKGRPFGNEEEGRSQVVSTVLRDSARKILPSLMRVFFGGERAVEFVGKDGTDQDAALARQRTDYINHIFSSDNPGFKILYSTFKDMLYQKLGFVKWWWEDATNVERAEYTGLTEAQLQAFYSDDEVEVEVTSRVEATEETPETFNATVTRTTKGGRVRVASLPPEEVIWNRSARDWDDDILMVAHDREVMVSDLVAMGYDLEDLMPLAGTDDATENRQEAITREFDEAGGSDTKRETRDPHTTPIRFTEAYTLLDKEGTGIASLYQVNLVGKEHELFDCVPVSHVRIAAFPFDPEPHTIIPLDLMDYTKDIQEVKSAMERGMLDSLSLSIHPRQEIVEGQVNIQDALNTEVGALIRVRQPGMIREVRHSFVGGDVLPAIDHWDGILEERLGLSRASAGLDADALQSTTKAAVSATMSAAQQQLELTARIAAEYGMRQLFRGLLRTVVENQDFKRLVRLRNEIPLEVDPRSWYADMDVTVNLALGSGLTEDRIAALRALAAEQKEIIGTLGPINPLCTLKEYRHTLALLTEMGGFPNVNAFWLPISDEQIQAMREAGEQEDQQQPPSDPATAALAQAELAKAETQRAKAEADIQLKQQELALREREIALEDDRARDEYAAEFVLKRLELQLKYQQNVEDSTTDAEVALARAEIDRRARTEVASIQARSQNDNRSGND